MTQRLALFDAHFRRICQLIYQRAGIVLADHKRDMVYNRTVRRLRTTGLDDFGRYLSMLEANQNSAEWQAFINSDYQSDRVFAKGIIFQCCQIMLVGAAVNTVSGARRRQPEKSRTALRLRSLIP